eukprot:g5961.t1
MMSLGPRLNCAGGKKNPSLKALAAEGAVVINANRKVTGQGLVNTLKGSHGVELKAHTARRLKRKVVGGTKTERLEDIPRLKSYLHKIADSSPGTITHSKWDEQGHFEAAFMMLGGVAHLAVRGVQQVACIDFCHCKGDWNGTIGAITVKSSNNNVIPVATCMYPEESADAYEYLINNACKNPEMAAFLNKPTTTIMTDKHKGSESIVPRVLHLSEHLRCGEHMLRNAGTVEPDGRMFFYEAARAPDKASCEAFIDKIAALNDNAGKYIREARRDDWAMYGTRGNVVQDQVTSNMSESGNNMIGNKVREDTPLGFFQEMVTCKVQNIGGGTHLVYQGSDRRHYNRVELTFDHSDPTMHQHTCTCGFCKRWRIPCRHVIAAAKARGEQHQLLKLIDDGYRLDKLHAAASDERFRIISPVWSDLDVDENHKLPLPVEGQAGRKKGKRATARKKSNGEFATSSRVYALHQASSNTQGAAVSGVVAVAATARANAVTSLSQGLSQGQGAGDA